MQQQLMHQMQQQPTGAFNSTSSITTDHIQQYLDENKALILNILENQNTGKFTECAENQTRLQHNLMYLAAIADSQPKQTPMHLQPYMNTIQQQQQQQQQQLQLQTQHMVPQSHMMAQSHTPFAQQPPFMQQALQSQLGFGLTGPSGISMEGESSRVFPDFSQLVFGEGSQGVSKQASRSTTKENRSNGSTDGGDNPQKKGKLSRAAA